MDETQENHLKAYGITYWVLQQDVEVDWLLNYRGGSFMCKYHDLIEQECVIRGVSYQIIADAQSSAIRRSRQQNPEGISAHQGHSFFSKTNETAQSPDRRIRSYRGHYRPGRKTRQSRDTHQNSAWPDQPHGLSSRNTAGSPGTGTQ